MKKVVLIAFVILSGICSSSVYAQVKIGYINSQELLQSMPEALKADTAVNQFAQNLQDQINIMGQELQTKAANFDKTNKEMSDAVKEVKTRELQDLQKRITDFQSTARDRVTAQRDQLFKPIIDKANAAIKEVAKANGYTYVFDSASGIILQAPDGDNILALVKKKLGIQ
ncbi:MAG: OmpH/Skp family outer membrane protein [Chitinophagaceae bacterium]